MPVEMVEGGADAEATPRSFTVDANAPYSLTTVTAEFDGTGAGESFLPALSVFSQDNKLVGRFFPDSEVAVGDVAQVTYSPFSRAGSAGIRFKKNNVGQWLSITTTGFGGPANVGFSLVVADVIEITSDDELDITSVNSNVEIGAGGDVVINASGDTSVETQLFVRLALGEKLEVTDNTAQPIFRVDENGDLHGKTGKALTFDL